MADRHSATFDYTDTDVLVSGGSGGIGGAIARAFAQAGAQVTVTGTGPADDYGAAIDGFAYQRLDVGDGDAVADMAATVSSLDVLVNCAGLVRPDGRDEYDPNAFARTLDVNLAGTFRLSQALVERLADGGGAICNIASMSSYFGLPGVPGYTASKGGVVALTRSLAVAWAAKGVRVNAIAPGWIHTKLSDVAYANPDYNKAIVARTPMGRWGQADEMAGAVLFLCSDAARFITGATLPVDGGYSAA